MKRLIVKVAALSCAAWMSSAANAQEDMTRTGEASERPRASLEVAPLILLMNAVPGAGAVGLAGEVFVNEKTALMAEGQYLNADLRTDTVNKLDSDLKPRSLDGYMASVGLQQYRNPESSSWYYGGKVGYAEADSNWDYRDATVDASTTAIVPAVMAGYRWLYGNNLTLRLGGTVGANLLQTSSFASSGAPQNAAEGRDKVEDAARLPATARVDFLVGYAM